MIGFKVQKKQCSTCIYRADSPLNLKKLEGQISDQYGGFTGHRICHHSDDACCAGFWAEHKDQFQVGQVAQRLNMVEFVDDNNRHPLDQCSNTNTEIIMIEITKTSRGFGLGEFADSKGVDCSIQESSLATEAAIWFGVQSANPQRIEGELLVSVTPPVDSIPIAGVPGMNHDILYHTRMHLTIDHVEDLIKNFDEFLTTKTVQKRCFKDRNGIDCSIQLTDNRIELGCDDANPQICDGGWRPVKFPEGTTFTTHVFLGADKIVALLAIMRRFVEDGSIC